MRGNKRERGEQEMNKGTITITENISLWEAVWSNRYEQATIA